MVAPFDVISKEKSELEGFLPKYWITRLGEDPSIDRIDGKATIAENIPNYWFSYNDTVIARKSFGGILYDPCKNDNLITSRRLDWVKGMKWLSLSAPLSSLTPMIVTTHYMIPTV